MTLSFVPVGIGDAFSERWYSTCFALDVDEGFILLDVPHPILKMLAEARASSAARLVPERLLGVVLTHLHGDHASGIESLAYGLFFGFGRKLPLYAHPSVLARLWDGHLAAGMEQIVPEVGAPPITRTLTDWIDVHPLDERAPTPLGPFAVECRPTVHHIPTTALRVAASGRRFAWSADTAFDPELVAWLADADVFAHEAGHGIHTPYASLAALPSSQRAKMRLVHVADTFDRAASAIEVLDQGRSYEV